MASKAAGKFDPRVSFGNLTQGEQSTITRFLYRWASVMTGAERTALLKRYPKAAAWCAGQWTRRPEAPQLRKFMERAADMTPAERKRLGLSEKLGPRFAPKATTAQFEKEQREKAAIVARVWPSRREEAFDPRAYAAEMATKAKIVEEAFPGLSRGAFDPVKYRNEIREKVAILKEEMPGLFGREFDPVKYRDEMRTKAQIVKEEFPGLAGFDPVKYANEMREKFAISGRLMAAAEVERKGTPNEQRQLARLKGSDYRLSEAERILDEGGWPAMERLNPGCTEKVWNKWLGGERPKWEAQLLVGKAPWELTRADVARSKLSMAQLSEVAYARRDSPVHKRLEELGIRVERPRPLGDYLKASTDLYRIHERSERKGDFFWLSVPGPMPMVVPVPRLSDWKPKGEVARAWLKQWGGELRPLGEKPGPAAALKTVWGRTYAAGGPAVQAAKAARIPAGKAIARALPDIVRLALQTGQLSPETGLAQAYGAYSLQVGARSALMRMGLSAAIAGPLSIVIGLAGLFSGRRRRRKAEEEFRRREAQRKGAGSARALTYQVGYVPQTVGVRYEPSRRRGAARPFRAQYGSRLGLAAATPTRPARI